MSKKDDTAQSAQSQPEEKLNWVKPKRPGEYLLFLGPEDRPPRKRYVTTTFRVPRWLSEQAHAMARAEDLSFSQFMLRGIKRELAAAGIPVITSGGLRVIKEEAR